MLISEKPEYKLLVKATMLAMKIDEERAVACVESAITDIQDGEASYVDAAFGLGLHVNLSGYCGFDAADYLSTLI